MHDLRLIREAPSDFDAGLARRNLPVMSEAILEIDARHRKLIQEIEVLRAERNKLSRQGKKTGLQDISTDVRKRVAEIRKIVARLELKEVDIARKLNETLAEIPNLLSPLVPDGADENDNREERKGGVIPQFDFSPRQHFELGESLGWMDFETAAKIAGTRFVVLKGPLARLERALANFMLDVHTRDFGYQEMSVPHLVRSETVFGTGQLPKFTNDLFCTTDQRWLIPTAEVPLTTMNMGRVFDADELPVRLTAWTPCYRSEAGAAGRDTRGMLRQHQFSKVELVSVTHPNHSRAELQRMTLCAESILERLGLAWRVMTLCSSDTGFAAAMTHDIEVWLPGQNAYREISSCSTCTEFQARRLNIRCRNKDDKENRYVHTLNGSGLAVGRMLIAVMETYQQPDGAILVPDALHPYTGNLEYIMRA